MAHGIGRNCSASSSRNSLHTGRLPNTRLLDIIYRIPLYIRIANSTSSLLSFVISEKLFPLQIRSGIYALGFPLFNIGPAAAFEMSTTKAKIYLLASLNVILRHCQEVADARVRHQPVCLQTQLMMGLMLSHEWLFFFRITVSFLLADVIIFFS
jgi:hypothetical protein